MAGAVTEFFAGVRLLVAGLALVVRRPRLFWLGVLPPLVMSVLVVGVLVVLVSRLDEIAVALTPFADSWSPNAAGLVRVLAGVGVLGGSVLIMVVSFTTVTLAVGSPIYDKISEYVDLEMEPALRPPAEPLTSSALRAVRQSLGLMLASALGAAVLFFAGLVPVVGQSAVPVVSAIFGGWMICIELIGSTFERRGLTTVADRRAAMRNRRARSLGLGVPTFLLLALPFAGCLVFPVATAAGTLLARDLVGGGSRSSQPRSRAGGSSAGGGSRSARRGAARPARRRPGG